MKCLSCGAIVSPRAKFCESCGKPQTPGMPSIPLPEISAKVVFPRATDKQNRGIYLYIGGMVLVVVAFMVVGLLHMNDDPVKKAGLSPDFCKQHPDASVCTSSSQPHEGSVPMPYKVMQSPGASTDTEPAKAAPQSPTPDPAVLKAVREEWIRNTQEALYRQGMEITFQARGTTLYVKYVLAGDAFAFQFHETFLGENGAILKTLGFKRVELSNGDKSWSWDLAGY